MIYFAQADVIGHIKIGFHAGTDANERMRELQTGSPVRLTLLGTMPGGKDTEADLHRRFAFAHVHGEWFRPTPEVLRFVGQQSGNGHDGPAEVQTRYVSIKVLTINGKQFTQNLFRQLQSEPVIDDRTGQLKGDPWGIVAYSPPGCSPEHVHVLWQDGEYLRRCCLLPHRHGRFKEGQQTQEGVLFRSVSGFLRLAAIAQIARGVRLKQDEKGWVPLMGSTWKIRVNTDLPISRLWNTCSNGDLIGQRDAVVRQQARSYVLANYGADLPDDPGLSDDELLRRADAVEAERKQLVAEGERLDERWQRTYDALAALEQLFIAV